MPAAFATKEAELACNEMLISEAKWRVRASQSLPLSPNAQKKQKSSLSETTPTKKQVHTFTAFAEVPEQRSPPKAGVYASNIMIGIFGDCGGEALSGTLMLRIIVKI